MGSFVQYNRTEPYRTIQKQYFNRMSRSLNPSPRGITGKWGVLPGLRVEDSGLNLRVSFDPCPRPYPRGPKTQIIRYLGLGQ